MKKLIPVILCCAMLLAACGSSADSAPAASESTSAAESSEAASSAESIIGGADGETDIAVSDEANTANLDAAVAAIEAVNPIANPRALDDFSVENELMLTMDNLVGYKGDVTNDQADCGLVFVAQAKDGKVDAVKAELEAYKESLSANDLYAEFADKVALAKDARITIEDSSMRQNDRVLHKIVVEQPGGKPFQFGTGIAEEEAQQYVAALLRQMRD